MVFLGKKIYVGSRGTIRDICILEREKDNKDGLSHFKRKCLKSINFDLVQYDDLDFAKRCMS
jgi:hypothetical protein